MNSYYNSISLKRDGVDVFGQIQPCFLFPLAIVYLSYIVQHPIVDHEYMYLPTSNQNVPYFPVDHSYLDSFLHPSWPCLLGLLPGSIAQQAANPQHGPSQCLDWLLRLPNCHCLRRSIPCWTIHRELSFSTMKYEIDDRNYSNMMTETW